MIGPLPEAKTTTFHQVNRVLFVCLFFFAIYLFIVISLAILLLASMQSRQSIPQGPNQVFLLVGQLLKGLSEQDCGRRELHRNRMPPYIPYYTIRDNLSNLYQ